MIHELSVLIQGFTCIIITLFVLLVHVLFAPKIVFINFNDSFLFKMIAIEILAYFENIDQLYDIQTYGSELQIL